MTMIFGHTQMRSRAEGLDSDMEKLKSAFSEISRIGAKLATEISSSPAKPQQPRSQSQDGNTSH